MFEIPEHFKKNTTIGHTNIIVMDNRLIYLGEPGIVEFSFCSIYYTLILAMSNLMLECGVEVSNILACLWLASFPMSLT